MTFVFDVYLLSQMSLCPKTCPLLSYLYLFFLFFLIEMLELCLAFMLKRNLQTTLSTLSKNDVTCIKPYLNIEIFMMKYFITTLFWFLAYTYMSQIEKYIPDELLLLFLL